MFRHRNGDRRAWDLALHHHVVASLADQVETVLLEDAADFPSERTRSLPNGDVDRDDVHLAVQPLGDLRLARCLEEQLERLLEIRTSLLDRIALAGDVDFGTQRHEAIALAFDHCC